MRRKATPEQWVKNNPEQLQWIANYLNSRKLWVNPFPDHQNLNEAMITHALNNAIQTAYEGRDLLFFERIRNAWSQHKHKKKHEKKIQNFYLKASTVKKLQRLTKQYKITKNECIENLIENMEELEANYRKKIAEMEKQLEENKFSKALPQYLNANHKSKNLEKVFDTFLEDYCRQEVLFGFKPVKASQITPQQQQQINKQKVEYKELYLDIVSTDKIKK